MASRPIPFHCGLGESLLAEVAGVPLDALHHDVDAICHAADAARPIAERLGVAPPKPHLAGFCYPHVSTLGAEVVFAEGSEPNVVPCISRPQDIDDLCEPDDYMACGVVPERLATLAELKRRRPDASGSIGHPYEGPITTAALLMGSDFFMLPHDDPARAHKLLRFCVESAVNYTRALTAHFGGTLEPGSRGMPDDFAGMFGPAQFAEFVVPYWDLMFEKLEATQRHVHSELLRVEHLHHLAELNIATFDPSADQYVTPELLREHCPVPFTGRIQSWHIRDHSPAELQAMYRRIAACEPVSISFYIKDVSEEPKIAAILEVARELAP